MEKTSSELKALLNALDTAHEKLIHKIEDEQKKNSDLQAQQDTLEQELCDLRDQQRDDPWIQDLFIQDLHMQIDELNSENQELKQTVEDLKEDNRVLRRHLRDLEEKLDQCLGITV